jgi:hypothetical protein
VIAFRLSTSRGHGKPHPPAAHRIATAIPMFTTRIKSVFGANPKTDGDAEMARRQSMVSVAVDGSKYCICHSTRLDRLAESRGGQMGTESIEYFGKVEQRYGSPPVDFGEGQRMYIFVRPSDDPTARTLRDDEKYCGYTIGERTAKGVPRTHEFYASVWIPRALFNALVVARRDITRIGLNVRVQKRDGPGKSVVFELDDVTFVDDRDESKRDAAAECAQP